MKEFMVIPDMLKQQGEKMFNIQQVIMPNIIGEIDDICYKLSRTSIGFNDCLVQLNDRLSEIKKEIKQLGNSAIDIAMQYKRIDCECAVVNSQSDRERNDDVPLADPTDATPSDDYMSPEEYVAKIDYEYDEDNIRVPITYEFLDKDYCMEMAKRIMEEHGDDGKCNDMSTRRIAKEIYAHALGYFFASDLQSFGIDSDLIQGIEESGEVADVGKGDGLEAWYNILWYWMDPFDVGPTYF